MLQKLSTLHCMMQVFRMCTTTPTTADPQRSNLRNYLGLSEFLSLWLWELSQATNGFCKHFLCFWEKFQLCFVPDDIYPLQMELAEIILCVHGFVHWLSSLEYMAFLVEVYNCRIGIASHIFQMWHLTVFSISETINVQRQNKQVQLNKHILLSFFKKLQFTFIEHAGYSNTSVIGHSNAWHKWVDSKNQCNPATFLPHI